MWEAVFIAVAAGVGLLIDFRRHHWRLKAWQNAFSSCGLKVVEAFGARGWSLRLHGRAGPVEVWIEESGAGAQRETRIVVTAPVPPGFADVRLRREQPEPAAREIEIGDEAFDSTFSLEGPARLVCALLDAETRRLLVSASSGSEVDIANGRMQASRVSNVSVSLPLLLAIGRRFTRLMEAPRLLADNVREDPEPGVRLRNLLLLIRELPGDPVTLEALRTACADPTPRVQLRAAQELGSERISVLAELAENTEDDATSAQAISLLGQELPVERARAILIHALRRRRLRTARACLESLGRSGGATAIDTLAKVTAREKGELAVAAALALGETASPAAETPLLAALQRDKADLRVAAANALGRAGTAAAVLPLKEAAERFSRDPDLRRATRQAIAEIQSRVQDASPGQLSLAGVEVGQLSLAQAEAGQLSLATGAAGQLSLPSVKPGQLSFSDGEED